MTENNYTIRDIKNKHLQYVYKKYTDHIINFEKHIDRIFRDLVIDINGRNYILQNLDNMIRRMIKIYNTNLMEIYNSADCAYDDIYDQEKFDKKYVSIYTNLSNSVEMIENIETNTINKKNPFYEIKQELEILAEKNGILNMSEFLKLHIGDHFYHQLNKNDLELFDLYDKVFVPLEIRVMKINKNRKEVTENFKISKGSSKCDGLMDRTCNISFFIKKNDTSIFFNGYIVSDVLNIYSRTSQIYSKYLFEIRKETRNIIKKVYPEIDEYFFTKYCKTINNSCYFTNNPTELVDKIIDDYKTFNDLTSKNFNSIMKEFVHADIKTMFNTIKLLLMGNDQNISIAVLLFNLLKDRKISGETLSDIIYHNLSFYSQIKVKKVSSSMKNELARLKTLTVENVSIEKRLTSLVNMPDNVKSYILEKINEIKTGENNYKLQMAVNGLMQFPWKPKDAKNEFTNINKSMSKSRLFLQNVAKKLNESVYGHENSKKVLIELVGKWIQNPESTGQVIGLVGPPGVGKTLLAKSISSALGIPLSIVGLGGMSDSADLIGHSFTYAGAQYGMIVRQMIKTGNWRSVMFFDEVDKVSKRNDTNEIYNTLIHITDPNMNQHFQDRFYSSSIEFDLSGVLIVFSYNDSSKLDPILLDRIREIKISPYSTREKISIAQNYVLKELCQNIGFTRDKIYFEDDTIRYLIEKYTLEAGVRELHRKLEQILLKVNIDRFYMRGPFRKIMKIIYDNIHEPSENNIESEELSEHNHCLKHYIEYNKSKLEDMLDSDTLNKIFNLDFDDKIIINQKLVHKYLDKPIRLVEKIQKNNMVGIINGLYATSIGMGGIVPIQILRNYIGDYDDGTNSKLKYTGNQKKIMRESVMCAYTTAVNILNQNIQNSLNKKFPDGFHVHAPDGATPKDGPSAGCAFTTAFISTILGKKINREIAMTGEIELTGKISKIGGLDAKLAGAKKAGVKCVYICEENREDYETIKKKNPELFTSNFEIKIVEHIIDIVSDPNVICDINDSDFDAEVIKNMKTDKTNN